MLEEMRDRVEALWAEEGRCGRRVPSGAGHAPGNLVDKGDVFSEWS
jgi:hypothetical protein